jgi:hypothetical protein
MLIAVIQEFANQYVLERPMTVVSMPVLNSKGKVERIGVYLKDWIEYTNDTYFTIPKDIVLVMAEPDEKMYADYIEAKVHSDLQKAQDELKEVMKKYISNMEFPVNFPMEEEDKTGKNGYNAKLTNEDNDEMEEGEDDDEDDGLPWWKGDPRIRF